MWVNWWKQIFAKILQLLGRQPAQLPPGRATPAGLEHDAADDLPEDLRAIVADMKGHKGVVVDTVVQALQDFRHLRQVMMGPGASSDAVDDVTLIAEAQHLLRVILLRAPEVKTLLAIATTRTDDKAGRGSAGDAILVLRDQGRLLHDLASAALQWASSRSEADREQLQACARRMAS
jgi:hypothetical protein